MTDRELKIKYLRDASLEKAKEFSGTKIEYLFERKAQIIYDLWERGRDAVSEDFIKSWHDAADDYLISTIDWSVLSECSHCNEYFEPNDTEFCSEDCAAIYESENSKKKKTNIFVK